MTPILQTTSVIKNCIVTSRNNQWSFHPWNTIMKTCKPVKLRLKLHKLQNNFLPSWSILSVVYHSEWCLGVNVNGSRYITSTCVCVCVCMHECESRKINWPEVEPVWTVITMHFSNLRHEEMPNKHDEYQHSTTEGNKCWQHASVSNQQYMRNMKFHFYKPCSRDWL